MERSVPVTPQILVNGIPISAHQINAELQYHPAENILEAHDKAMCALVVRELLLQEAHRKAIFHDRCEVKDEQAAIDQLLKQEIKVPTPDLETCQKYYKNNRHRFVTSPLCETSHILFSLEQKNYAEEAALQLRQTPAAFEDLARQYSLCPSGKEGGRLGQISKGQTTPEFEIALFKMRSGDTSKEPVKTRYGFHIIRLHQRSESKELPLSAVQKWIADYLGQAVWRRAVSQYIALLAGKSDIQGYSLRADSSPLVQ